jgi:ATP-dependent Lhr-like helicase
MAEHSNRLRATWPIFFSRFGRLLPVQEATIPHILDGRNVLVCSPTATGKTEAVVAPICERLLSEPADTVQCLYIAPTRALVNDLDARLADPLRELDISYAVKTGDRPVFDKRRPARFVITTPESFDSILSRSPEVLMAPRWLVLDEIHLLDGTYRGDQLRVLVKRVPGVRIAALSATVSTPKETGSRYMDSFEIVVQPGAREIDFTLMSADELPLLRAQFMDRGIRKAIFFCNTRKDTESLSATLRSILPADKVYAHHGSLSQAEREDVERAMRDGRIGFAVATMTLEFGIDIGDVDAIVLYGAPDSVSSLLQRLGRGNRRTGTCIGYALFRDKTERNMMVKLLDRALKGQIEKKRYAPHLSVVVQQIFSMVFRGKLVREPLLQLCSEEELEAILAHLRSKGYLHGDLMGEELAELAERGVIHSNIDDSSSWEVVDMRTLQVIGDAPVGQNELVMVGGRVWSVHKRVPAERRVYVKPSAAKVDPGSFSSRGSPGHFFSFLPSRLQEIEKKRRL